MCLEGFLPIAELKTTVLDLAHMAGTDETEAQCQNQCDGVIVGEGSLATWDMQRVH
jgi:hypothetical protein